MCYFNDFIFFARSLYNIKFTSKYEVLNDSKQSEHPGNPSFVASIVSIDLFLSLQPNLIFFPDSSLSFFYGMCV